MYKGKDKKVFSGDGEETFSADPDFYVHYSLKKAIDALDIAFSSNRPLPDALAYQLLRIDIVEKICMARGYFSDEDTIKGYNLLLEEYNKKLPESNLKESRAAIYKLKLLMERVFASSPKDVELTY